MVKNRGAANVDTDHEEYVVNCPHAHDECAVAEKCLGTKWILPRS